MRAVKPDQLQEVLVRKLGILRADVLRFPPDPEAVRLVPRAQCHRHRVLPLCLDAKGRLVVAMDDPMSNDALEAVRFSSGRRAVPVLAGWRDIRIALGSVDAWEGEAPPEADAHASPPPGADDAAPEAIEFDLSGFHELTSRLTLETPVAGEKESADAVRESDSTLVRLVNKVILDAMESGASDIISSRQRATVLPGSACVATGRCRTTPRSRAIPLGDRVAHQSHGEPRHRRAQEAPGREDRLLALWPCEAGAARGHHSDRQRARERDPALAWLVQAASGRQAVPRPGHCSSGCGTSSKSRTACCSYADPPARARPRRCIRLISLINTPSARSGPPRIPSRSRKRVCRRCR